VTALSLSLVVPWAAGLLLTLLDGRRRVIGWVAVAALAVNLGALVALAAAVLPDDPVVVTTGDWPVGIGITLRADALGVLFALLSSLALLAATGPRPETIHGVLALSVALRLLSPQVLVTAAYKLRTIGFNQR